MMHGQKNIKVRLLKNAVSQNKMKGNLHWLGDYLEGCV